MTAVPDPRLFIGVMPAGISYADRSRNKDGDYVRLAFLPFGSLELKVYAGCPGDLRDLIVRHARSVQDMRGEHYQVSATGQTVILGGPI